MRLAHRLLDVSRDKEIGYLYGLVLPENERMLRLFRSLDLPEHEYREEVVDYAGVELRA